MAENPSRILSSLNAMLDAKEIRRQGDVMGSLKGMELAQRNLEFKEQMRIQEETLNINKQNQFVTLLDGLSLDLQNAELESGAAFWSGYLNQFNARYMKSDGQTYKTSGGWVKGETYDMVTALTGAGMNKNDANNLFGLISGYNQYYKQGKSNSKEAVGIMDEIMDMFGDRISTKIGSNGKPVMKDAQFGRALAAMKIIPTDSSGRAAYQDVMGDIERHNKFSETRQQLRQERMGIPSGDLELDQDYSKAYDITPPKSKTLTKSKEPEVITSSDMINKLAVATSSQDKEDIMRDIVKTNPNSAYSKVYEDLETIPGTSDLFEREKILSKNIQTLSKDRDINLESLKQLNKEINSRIQADTKGWNVYDKEQKDSDDVERTLLTLSTELLSNDILAMETTKQEVNEIRTDGYGYTSPSMKDETIKSSSFK